MYNNIKFYTPPPRTRLQNARIWCNVITEIIQFTVSEWWQTLRNKTRRYVKL